MEAKKYIPPGFSFLLLVYCYTDLEGYPIVSVIPLKNGIQVNKKFILFVIPAKSELIEDARWNLHSETDSF